MPFWMVALILLGLSGAPEAEASEKCLHEVCFDASQQIAGRSLPLKGVGLLEYLKFDMYTGALYAPETVDSVEDVLADIPKKLVLNYHRGIKVSWMNKAAERLMKKNPDVDFQAIADRVAVMASSFAKVDKNDRYALVYEPGKGTSLYLNGDFIVTVPGADFQRAYFGIWLSHVPSNEKLRDRLIGIQKS